MTDLLAITGGYVVPVSGDPIENGIVVVAEGVIFILQDHRNPTLLRKAFAGNLGRLEVEDD